MKRFLDIVKNALLVNASILLSILCIEVLLRWVWLGGDRYYLFPPHYVRQLTPSPQAMPGASPVVRFVTNSYGIRGNEWSPRRAEEYRLLAVGGSTTECLYLDQDKTWAALLEADLRQTADGRKIWIGNLGKAGFNTRDHLAFMRFVMDQYAVDMVIMLVGGNDLIHRLIQDTAYDPHLVHDTRRYWAWVSKRYWLTPLFAVPTGAGWSMEQTAIIRLVKRLREQSIPQAMYQDTTGEWMIHLRKQRHSGTWLDSLPALEAGIEEYGENIEAIMHETRRRGLRLLLFTQPTLWKASMPEEEDATLWMGEAPQHRFYKAALLASAMERYNQRLLAVCHSQHVECLDIATLMPRTLTFFYDDMHFTEAGAVRVAAEAATYMRTRPPFVTARARHETP